MRACEVPKSASAKADPKWEKLAGGDVWAWHDHRIHYMNPIPPPQIKAEPRKRHHVFDWKVPATENGKKFFVAGSLDYKPPPKKRLPVRARHLARRPRRGRDDRPLRPPPRPDSLSEVVVASSILPSDLRMSATLTSISSPSR